MCPEDFVLQHNIKYKFYCEAVIFPDGDIQYAFPSHQQKLVTLYGITVQEIQDNDLKYLQLLHKIPIEASPVHWMCEDLNVISCWYDFCIIPMTYTSKQIKALKCLLTHGCISSTYDFDVTVEKSLISKRYNKDVTEKDLEALINRKSYTKIKINKLLFEKTK